VTNAIQKQEINASNEISRVSNSLKKVTNLLATHKKSTEDILKKILTKVEEKKS
jgi:hypothetical protein